MLLLRNLLAYIFASAQGLINTWGSRRRQLTIWYDMKCAMLHSENRFLSLNKWPLTHLRYMLLIHCVWEWLQICSTVITADLKLRTTYTVRPFMDVAVNMWWSSHMLFSHAVLFYMADWTAGPVWIRWNRLENWQCSCWMCLIFTMCVAEVLIVLLFLCVLSDIGHLSQRTQAPTHWLLRCWQRTPMVMGSRIRSLQEMRRATLSLTTKKVW